MAEKLVGQNYTTPDLIAKVTGKSKYAEDFRAEGMLFAKLLLSPHPHARVTRIDTSAAMALPGVKAILTADDLPAPADAVNDNGDRRGGSGRGHRADRDRVPGATLRGRSVGEPASEWPQRAHERKLLVHSAANAARSPAAEEPAATRDP